MTMTEHDYLELPILQLSKIVMYEFRYEYVNPKHDGKTKFCYIDKKSFFLSLKTDDIYKDTAENGERSLDTSKYDLNRSVLKAKKKKVIAVMKDELGVKVMNEFYGLRAKTYDYLTDGSTEDKKAKSLEECVKKVC